MSKATSRKSIVPTAHFASLVYGPAGVPTGDPAEEYHEASRLYPHIAPPQLAMLLELEAGSGLVRTIARSSLTHAHRQGLELPAALPLLDSLGAAIARRCSRRAGYLRAIRLAELATVLSVSYAATVRPDRVSRRPVPSAGALYPLDLYAIVLAVDGVERGIYHYDPFRHRLEHLRPVDVADVKRAFVDAALPDTASAVLVVTSVFWRSRCKYGPRGYRFSLLEAGHLAQNAVLAASALDLSALPVGGFYDRRLDELVGADGLDQASVYALVLGAET